MKTTKNIFLSWILTLAVILTLIPTGALALSVSADPLEEGGLVVTTAADTVVADGETSLREAVAAAVDGDIIAFDPALFDDGADGRQPITITLSGEIAYGGTDDAVRNKTLTLRGPLNEDGNPLVTLSGNNANRILNNVGAGALTLAGLKFTNGYTGSTGNGGAVYAGSASSGITVTNCTFTQNMAHQGGALYANGNILTASGCTFIDNLASGGGVVYGATSAVLENCTFTGNSATSGGVVYANNGTVTATDCTFIGNTAASEGGVVCALDGPVTATDCTFSDNTAAASHGGTVYALGGPVTATDCTFTGNTAQRNGGVVYTNDVVTVAGCAFSGNKSVDSGGVIYAKNSSVTVTDCTFTGNSANRNGVVYADGSVTAEGCAFTGNSASVSGGAVFVEGAVTATDCMFTKNTTNDATGAAVEARSSIHLFHCTVVNNPGVGRGVLSKEGGLYLNNSIVAGNAGGQISPATYTGASLIEGVNGVTRTEILGGNVADENGYIRALAFGVADGTATALTAADLMAADITDAGERASILTALQKDLEGITRGSTGAVTYGALETTADDVVENLSVKTPNTLKTVYHLYEDFSPAKAFAGGELTVINRSGAATTVSMNDVAVTNNAAADLTATPGTKTVTFTYAGKTCALSIEVLSELAKEFKFEVTVSGNAAGRTFAIPLSGQSGLDTDASNNRYKPYHWNIDWGDGETETKRYSDSGAPSNSNISAGIPHTYASGGTYTITITPADDEGAWLAAFGFCDHTFGANAGTNKAKLTKLISPITPDMTRSGNDIPHHEWALTFYYCANLTMGDRFTFAGWEDVTEAGDYFAWAMFSGCSGDSFNMGDGFNLPQSLTTVGNDFASAIFNSCSGNRFTMNPSVNLPRNITSAGNYFAYHMFFNCSGDAFTMNEEFNLPQGITTTGDLFAAHMFSGCSGAEFTMNPGFNLPQNITAIGNNFAYGMFTYCSGDAFTMNEVFNLPQGITEAGNSFAEYMFAYCSGTAFTMNADFNLPQGITSAGAYFASSMYSYCSGDAFSMNDVFNLPQGIACTDGYFAMNMFYNCSGDAFTMNEVFNLTQGITTTDSYFATRMFGGCAGNGFTVNNVFAFPALSTEDLNKDGMFYQAFYNVTNFQTRNAASIIGANAVPKTAQETFTGTTGFVDRAYIHENWGGNGSTSLTDMQRATFDVSWLTFSVIRKNNTAPDKITGNLNLPTTGYYGSTITWAATPAGVINTATGAVTCPADSDAPVTLTATVANGSVIRTKPFVLIVTPPPTLIPGEAAFAMAAFGYGAQEAQVFSLTNQSAATLTGLALSLNGGSGSDFEIVNGLSATLAAGGTATFSVRPKTGLAAGDYNDTLILSGAGGLSLTTSLRFTVGKADQSTLQITPPSAKTYGGSAFALATTGGSGTGAVSFSVTSGSDVISVSGSTVTILKAGTANVTATKVGDGNYNAVTSAPITVTVNPKPVTITGIGAQDKVYDGTTAATITGTGTVNGRFGSDDVTVVNGTASFSSASAGNNKMVTFTGFSLGGTAAGNYILSAQPASVTASINSPTVSVTDVSLDRTSLSLKVNAASTLMATVSPTDATNKAVTWSSSDSKVAKVENGKVTALKAGKATITVTTIDGGFSKTCAVTVTANQTTVAVKSVSIAGNPGNLIVGKIAKLRATVSPDNATNKAVTWSSSDSKVAKVENGKVTALKAGKATITVTTIDGGFSKTCAVTVTANQTTVSVKSVSVAGNPGNLIVGKIAKLRATVSPDNATSKTVTWKSSDAKVATVDKSTGKVTAMGGGKVNITATAGGKSKTVSITVHQYVTLRIGKTKAIQNSKTTTIDSQGTKPFKISGKTMVPVRFVAEKMGGKVTYKSDSQPIVMTYGNRKVELRLNRKEMKVKVGNKTSTIILDVAAQKKNGRTFIPLRAIGQALGFTVYYEAGTEIIVVNNPSMTSAIKKERVAEGKKVIK